MHFVHANKSRPEKQTKQFHGRKARQRGVSQRMSTSGCNGAGATIVSSCTSRNSDRVYSVGLYSGCRAFGRINEFVSSWAACASSRHVLNACRPDSLPDVLSSQNATYLTSMLIGATEKAVPLILKPLFRGQRFLLQPPFSHLHNQLNMKSYMSYQYCISPRIMLEY
jgi:hypothetical protein